MHSRLPNKILIPFIPLLFTFLLWIPNRAKTSETPLPKAVIKSCASQMEEIKYRAKPYSPSAAMNGAGGGYSYTTGAPPSMPPIAKMEAKASTPSEAMRTTLGVKDQEKLDVHQAGKKVQGQERRASELYLSNDDSMSLASAQRIIYAITNFLPLYQNEIRPHEFLNYFHFKTNPVPGSEVFSVKTELAPREKGQTLAFAVQGRTLSVAQRRPAVLTLIVDKSGSMSAQGKMEYLKEGLEILKNQLKPGDVLNVVEFDHETCNAMEGFVVGRDSWNGYDQTVKELAPRGSTNLHDGLVEGYKLADRFQDPGKINRVILITDAIANTGELSPDLMASIGKYYDTKQIALSGVGVGLDFNDELLNTLTDKGKGAYLFIGLKDALPRVFGGDFISLLDTVARDVHFKSTFPKGLHLDIFYGEEVSTVKEKVQPIHYYANTSQLFLLDLLGKAEGEDAVKLQIEYTDPLNNTSKTLEFSASLAQLQSAGQENIAKARALMAFATLMADTALPGSRPYGGWYQQLDASSKNSEEGKKKCSATLEEMKKQTAIYSDQETQYVTDLANKYCSRF